MIRLITTSGRSFPIDWIGISDFDGSLRFEVLSGDMAELYRVFTDPAETQELTRVYDEDRKTFTGYTFFKGLEYMHSGNVVVRLLKG